MAKLVDALLVGFVLSLFAGMTFLSVMGVFYLFGASKKCDTVMNAVIVSVNCADIENRFICNYGATTLSNGYCVLSTIDMPPKDINDLVNVVVKDGICTLY